MSNSAISATGTSAKPNDIPPAPLDRRDVPRDKLLWSIFSLGSWILLFSAGLLVETVEYRFILAPISIGKQLKPEEVKALKDGGLLGANGEPVKVQSKISLVSRAAYSFVAAVFCFTPMNLALLALVSGLLGGCASNITIETMPDEHRARLGSLHPRRNLFLQEPPISAALRGFIVYLCVIAGLFVVMDDPFKEPTAGQYVRLAGTLSIMAFIVGYDASRLEDWIRAIPGPNRRQPVPDASNSTKDGANADWIDNNEGGLANAPIPRPKKSSKKRGEVAPVNLD